MRRLRRPGLALICALVGGLAAFLPAGHAAAGESGAPRSSPILGQPGLVMAAPGQTLMDVARFYDLGYVELMAANPGVDPWAPPADWPLTLPTAHIPPPSHRRGIVVNLAEMRLYWYAPKAPLPVSFPIGIGREGWEMPPGTLKVVRNASRRVGWCRPRSAPNGPICRR